MCQTLTYAMELTSEKDRQNLLPSCTLYTRCGDSLQPDDAFPIPIKKENNAINTDELWVKNRLTTFHISQWRGRSLGPYLLVSLGCVSVKSTSSL